MIRFAVLACALLCPAFASAQSASGVPVVFFSIFGPEGEQLQRFYTDLFEWKIAPGGDLMTAVTSPLPATIGKGAPETIVYVGVDDITATLAKVVAEAARSDSRDSKCPAAWCWPCSRTRRETALAWWRC